MLLKGWLLDAFSLLASTIYGGDGAKCGGAVGEPGEEGEGGEHDALMLQLCLFSCLNYLCMQGKEMSAELGRK